MSRLDQGISPNPYDPEFQNRLEYFSPRLLESPNSNLDPSIEIPEYFKRQDFSYMRRLERFMQQPGMQQPMDPKCDGVICMTVPNFGVRASLQHALDQYLIQTDRTKNMQAIDPRKFEIIILLGQGSEKVVGEVKDRYPELRIRFMEEVSDTSPSNETMKLLYDLALLRAMRRNRPSRRDLTIFTHDSNLIAMSPTYIRDVLQAMDINEIAALRDANVKKIDAIVGSSDIKRGSEFQGEGNIMVRASTYAALGGINVGIEDVGNGFRLLINLARENDPRVIPYLQKAWLITDPTQEFEAINREIESALDRPQVAQVADYEVEYLDYEEFNGVFAEIFIEKDYPWNPDSSNPRPRVVDLGGHIGMSVLHWKSIAPDAQITVVEANPETAKILRRNIERNRIEDVVVIEGATTDREGEVNLYLSKPGMDFRWGDFVEGRIVDPEKYDIVSVPSVRLSSLINGPTDLLKINIEGAELEVLKEAESQLHNVREILMEFHNDPDNPTNSYQEMRALLERQGFYIAAITYKGKAQDSEYIDFSRQIFLHMQIKRR